MQIIKTLLNDQKKLFLLFFSLAALLTVPSLFNGFVLDDYYHRIRMLNISSDGLLEAPKYLWGLFSFLHGDPEKTNLLISQGVLPWWALPEIKYTFFRPLSELSIFIDYLLWPNSAWAMHLHNTFWFVLCVWSAGLFLFIYAPKPVAILSLLFFILEGSHGFAISWIASRNALIACAMSFFALYFIAKCDLENKQKFYYLSMIFHVLALSAGEIGISSAGFICWYLLIMSNNSLIKKIAMCIPFVVITLLWLGLRSYLDFGAYGSGAYTDPFASPEAFISIVFTQLPMVFFALCLGIPVEIFDHLIKANAFISYQSYLILSVFLLLILLPLYLKNKRAYFYLLASFTASIPVLAGELQSRVLILVSFPVLCFVAECLFSFWEMQKRNGDNVFKKIFLKGPWYFSMYGLAVLALISHLLLAPMILIFSQGLIADKLGKGLSASAASLYFDETIKNKTLLLLNPPNASAAGYLSIMNALENKPRPKNSYLLSSGAYGVEIKRTGINSFEIIPNEGFLADSMDRVMRSDNFPLVRGESLFFDGLIINVSEINQLHRPSKVAFYFSNDLSSEQYLIKCWQGSAEGAALKDCKLPDIGQSLRLAPVSF